MKVALILEAIDKASRPIAALQKTVKGFNAGAAKGVRQSTVAQDKATKAVSRTTKATAAYHASNMKGTAKATLGHAQTARAMAIVTRATEQATRAAERQTRTVRTSARVQADAAIAAARTAAEQDRATAAAARTARQTERVARAQRRTAVIPVPTAGGGASPNLPGLAERRGRQFGLGLRWLGGGAARAGRGVAAAGRTAGGVAMGTGVLGVGAGMAMNQLVQPASQFEQLNNALFRVEQTANKTRASMVWLENFSLKSSFGMPEATEAFVRLRQNAIDPTRGALKTLGDVAAGSDTSIMQVTTALTKGMAGAHEGLQQFGITAKTIGKGAAREIQYIWTDAETGSQKAYRASANDTGARAAAILKVMEAGYAGSTERFIQTWDGMVRRLGNAWSAITSMVMGAGLFDWMKGRLGEFLATVERMAADGSLKVWVEDVSRGLQRAMEIAWEFGKGLVGAFKIILPRMESAAGWLGGWDNLALAFIALPFLPAVLGIAAGFAQIAGGVAVASLAFVRILGVMRSAGMLTPVWQGLVWVFRLLTAPLGLAVRGFMMLGTAFMATPIGWVVAGIAAVAAAAYLIYDNWGSIGPWFQRQWEAVKGWFSDAWAAIAGFEWGSLVPDIEWMALIPSFEWSSIIPDINWRYWFTFSWPDVLPDFEWSSIIPSMPDFSSWFGSGAEKLGAALPNDPAALERMAAASGRIAEHTAAIAAVDTSAALAGVSGVSEAATRATALAEAIMHATRQAMAQARAVMSGVSFHSEGAALMSTLAAGIRAGAGQAVAAVRDVAQRMRDHLPHSPAKTGPLSDLHRVRFSETLASAIRPGPAVAAVSAVAASMMGALPVSMAAPVSAGATQGGGGVTVHAPLNVTVNGAAPDAQMDFERLLREHAATIERIVSDAAHGRARLEY